MYYLDFYFAQRGRDMFCGFWQHSGRIFKVFILFSFFFKSNLSDLPEYAHQLGIC